MGPWVIQIPVHQCNTKQELSHGSRCDILAESHDSRVWTLKLVHDESGIRPCWMLLKYYGPYERTAQFYAGPSPVTVTQGAQALT